MAFGLCGTLFGAMCNYIFFFAARLCGAAVAFDLTSLMMIDSIPTLTIKNKMPAAHSPGTKVEYPLNSS